jgi:dTDP-4-amino-4,6-dideoxygalactose transaminase
MNTILKIARKHNLLIVEDAAQAHLSKINEKPVGTFGDAAAFSFYPTKNMTSGEGGMIAFKSETAARLAKLYRNQGMEKRYQNEVIGFNLRMTDIHAAIGIEQLKKLPKWTELRQRNAKFLSENISGVATPYIPEGFEHVFHQFTIRVSKSRDEFCKLLTEQGIGNDVYYPTQVHKLPSFNLNSDLVETQKATENVISLPVHPSLTKKNLKTIARVVSEIAKKLNG